MRELYREFNCVGYEYTNDVAPFLRMLTELGLLPKRLVNYEILKKRDGTMVVEFPTYRDFLDLDDLWRVWHYERGTLESPKQGDK